MTDYLLGTLDPMEYMQTLDGEEFAGFNLLVGRRSLATCPIAARRHGELSPGIYGLSNATLDSRWDKVERSKERLPALLLRRCGRTHPVALMADPQKGPVDEVCSSRLPFATAHAITAPFIVLPGTARDVQLSCALIIRQVGRLSNAVSQPMERLRESSLSFGSVDSQ